MTEKESKSGIESDKGLSNSKRRKWSVDQGIALIVAAGIAAAATYFGTRQTQTGQLTPGPTVTATVTAPSSPAPSAKNLEFSLTADAKVPFCQVYRGTGEIPGGYVLVIFDTPAGADGQPSSPPFYSFDGQAAQVTAGHWSTEPLQLGTEGQAGTSIDIVGVLTSSSYYRLLGSIRALNGWISGTLPPGPSITLPVSTNGERGLKCTK
jgi:hypothetical protein